MFHLVVKMIIILKMVNVRVNVENTAKYVKIKHAKNVIKIFLFTKMNAQINAQKQLKNIKTHVCLVQKIAYNVITNHAKNAKVNL